MLTAPELVVAQLVEVGGEVQVSAEEQGRVLTERVVGREERAEAEAADGHEGNLRALAGPAGSRR